MSFEFLKEEDHLKYYELIKSLFNVISGVENLEKLGSNVRVLILKDNDNIAGTGMITLKYDPFKDKKTFYLDYICVSSDYQNQGLGKKILSEIERIGKEEQIDRLELTSNSKRCYAQKLYSSFGMEIRDTNVFEKNIK